MRLIEVPEFLRQFRGAPVWRSFHTLQEHLKSHNPGEALGRKAHPMSQEAIQMPEADLALAGDLHYSYLSAAFLD